MSRAARRPARPTLVSWPAWAVWVARYAAAYALVAVLALSTKLVVEAGSGVVYEPHWSTTMPLLALLFVHVLRKQPADERGAAS